MTVLLENFLTLLSIAEEWNMPTLKTKITNEIIENNNLIEHLPWEFSNSQLLKISDTYPDIPCTVLKAAELYHAEELEKYLKAFKEQNGPLLDDLMSDELSPRYLGVPSSDIMLELNINVPL